VAPESLDRIVQLLAKTNQFILNSNTIFSSDLGGHPRAVVALRLTDRLQDYGIVAVAVTSLGRDSSLNVENWVMSCRMFSQRLEFAIFEEILRFAEQYDAETIRLIYQSSGRNGLIADLLSKLGFAPAVEGKMWITPVKHEGHHDLPPHHMKIRHTKNSNLDDPEKIVP